MTEVLAPQKRNRRIAMSAEEVDEFLTTQHTVRVATADLDGPHVTALWFVWTGGSLWLYSITRSRRWAALRADPRIAVLVDDGTDPAELRGVEIVGDVRVVGELPRVGRDCPELLETERAWTRKYFGGEPMHYDGRHGWLEVTPRKITSWDFRKIGANPA